MSILRKPESGVQYREVKGELICQEFCTCENGYVDHSLVLENGQEYHECSKCGEPKTVLRRG